MKRKFTYIARLLVCLFLFTNIFTVETVSALSKIDVSGFIQQMKASNNNTDDEIEDTVFDSVYGQNEEIELLGDIPEETVMSAVYNKTNQIIVKYKDTSDLDSKSAGSQILMNLDSYLDKDKKPKQAEERISKLKANIKDELKLRRLDTRYRFKHLNIDVLETEEKDLNKLVQRLNKASEIEYIQPNYKLTIVAASADPLFEQQWGLYNVGQEIGGEIGRAGVDINVLPAWNLTKGSREIVVGVLDSGIDVNHEDLKGNIYTNPGEIAGNGIDDDGNGYIDDVHGWDFFNGDNSVYDGANFDMHGTAVAGVIAAQANGKGTIGVAPEVKIMPLKFIHGTTGYTCDAIKAIEYAMSKGIKIINCSFGGSDNNYALKDSIENSGILFIAAAGNRGGDTLTHPTYPACFNLPNVLGVASINNEGVRSKFSGYGKYIDIAAPGEQLLTTMPENNYGPFTGTSASTALVTGVAALLKSYEKNLNYREITDRIMNNAVVCNTLQGKVTSNGRMDAYGVLSNVKPQPDPYVNPEGDPLDPGDNAFNNDSWYTMDQLSKIKEQIHYGESGVNPATGNYSFTVNDMEMDAPGFKINISRTYNAKDEEKGSMGRGWTFGFQGSIFGENNIRVSLPNGSVQMFKKQSDGTYKPEDNRSIFIKNADETYTLTTKDQYKYYFNKQRFLTRMMDPRGNEVNINVDSTGKIASITDQLGRSYQVTYNGSGQIREIKDPIGRITVYDYQNGLLSVVTDPAGSKMRYSYDSHGYLTEIRDHNNTLIEKLTYNHTTGYDQGKVIQAVDAYGSVAMYTYDTTNKKTTVVENSSARTWVYWYDASNYITKLQDPEGRVKETQYHLTDGENKFGDVKSEKDEYGNQTFYDIDLKGNVTRITYPDGSTKTMAYDEKNNLIKETDQEGKVIYYIYDESKVYLLKKLESFIGSDQALDTVIIPQSYTVASYVYGEAETQLSLEDMFSWKTGDKSRATILESVYGKEQKHINQFDIEDLFSWKMKDENEATVLESVYGEEQKNLEQLLSPLSVLTVNPNDVINPENYAITTYTYYSNAESQANGWKAKGLLKSETDPEGNITTYSYDQYGNIETIKDAENHVTTLYYNAIGWKTKEVTPKGYTTNYLYNKNGQLVKIIEHEGETKRIVYDVLGRKIKEIEPNQYAAADDDTINYGYNGNYGRRYEYFENGLLKAEIDPMNHRTEYTYDVYGNMKTKLLPSGGMYLYTYDKLDRRTKVQFCEAANGEAKTLEEYEYAKTFDNKKQVKYTQYLNHKDKAVTITSYDYMDNVTLVEYPDGNAESSSYYLNGKLKSKTLKNGSTAYYYYDALNRLIKEYIPLDHTNDNLRYTYRAYSYDRSGKKVGVKIGIDGVYLEDEPQNLITFSYLYDKNGRISEERRSSGGKIVYTYDGDGNPIKKEEYIDNQNKKITAYTYNHRKQKKTETLQVRSGDIYGYDSGSNTTIPLTVTYAYDKNGNLKEVINAEGIKVTYEYDENNNQKKIINHRIDESGKPVAITTETFYDYQGQPIKVIDSNGNVTEYEYDKRGLLVKTKKPLGAVSYYQYDIAGRKIGEVTPKNYDALLGFDQMNRLVYTYDLMGRVLTKEYYYKNTQGQWLRIVSKAYQYDRMGQVTKEMDALGYKNGYGTFMTYDLGGNLKTVVEPVSKDRNKPYSMKYEYDALGRKISETNGKGVITKYKYDTDGNMLRISRQKNSNVAEIILEENTYDYLGDMISKKDHYGNTMTYTYTTFGSIASVEYPFDNTIERYKESYQYDKAGRLIRTNAASGRETKNVFDELGRLLSKTTSGSNNENAITIKYTYDHNGNQLSEMDGNQNITTFTYDELNRLKTESYMVAGVNKLNQYTYDLNGNIILTTDWRGNQYTKVYDPLDRLIEEKDPYGKVIRKLEYNDNHQQIKDVDALGNITEFQYDKNNRLIYTKDPMGKIEGISYDDVGNMVAKTDKNNRTISYSYNEDNKLIEVAAPDGSRTKYGYDFNGNMITKTDGNGNTVTYEYNNRNVLIKEIMPEGRSGEKGNYIYQADKVISYTYYGDGNLKSKVDQKGQKFDYGYDIHGRVKREVVNGQTKKEYTYDSNSNILLMTDAQGTTTMSYDAENRLLTKDVPGQGIIRYTYDLIEGVATGEIKSSVTDPKGNITFKTFDKAGRLKTVENKSEATQYAYYDNGSRKEIKYPGGISETYEYSKRGEVTKLVNKKADGTIIEEYAYTYDDNGNQLTKIDKRGITVYTYDSMNRLKEVNEPNGAKTTFDFDKAGNRTSQIEVVGGTVKLTNYTYNNLNQLVNEAAQISGKTTETEYRYDANGNLVSKAIHEIKAVNQNQLEGIFFSTAGDGKTTEITLYQYDEYNQMMKTVTGNKTITYGYSMEGLRDKKSITSVNAETGGIAEEKSNYIYDGTKVILETDGSGKVLAENVYGLNLITRTANNERAYYLYNAHGDVTALTDQTGKVLGTYQYDAFGNIKEKTYQKSNPYTYAGYRYDEEMDIYYLNARYYDPKIARFITQDTYKGQLNDPLSLNLYTYAHNEPIMYIDPTGHSRIDAITGAIAGGLAGGITGAIAGAISGVVEKTKDRDRDRSGESSTKGSSNVTGSLGPSLSSFFGNPVGMAISNVLEAVKIHYRKSTSDVDGSSRSSILGSSTTRWSAIIASIDPDFSKYKHKTLLEDIKQLKAGSVPIGISEDEIQARANQYVNDLLERILLENDGYLFKESVLSYRISDLETQLNRYKGIDYIDNLKSGVNYIEHFKSKNLKEFISEFESNHIDEFAVDLSDIIKYGMEKEITVTINQIKNLGDYKYLIHDKYARNTFMQELDLQFDKHSKTNIKVYNEKVNNEILQTKILTRIMEVKLINSNYEKSKTNYEILKESVRRETEEYFKKEAEKQLEKLKNGFHGYPLSA
ncbi:RHS repeat-associated protein [Anaerosolibacter carboniphilus]|uniref:RHS repeat-associated protein n=1 Tax=Anaerosolibacter carboniphilus TaxID=1417629 RepID=A0A841KKY4_9FIRM|nr:S8 family serine peptidase [Anaerosolibacter carboniphilus]MBB6214107.1 RHS repeat-associated protein [Anaerosolibacter carboniphilus]